MKDVLVFGRNGQVAREIAALAPDARFVGRDEADLSDPASCARLVRDSDCRAVINAAAYTAVDAAESDADTAHLVNAAAPAAIAGACAERGIPFLHISTDYVFDGEGDRPWREDDTPGPIGVYGQSKLAGEKGVIAAGGQWAILRTAWVFSSHGSNFVKTMLRLGAERDALRVVADQQGGPTPARDIALACLTMVTGMIADGKRGGLYHFAGAPDTNWASFAREIMRQAGLSCRVTDITTADYPTPAARPKNSRLNCRKIEKDFAIVRPDWRAGLAETLRDLKP